MRFGLTPQHQPDRARQRGLSPLAWMRTEAKPVNNQSSTAPATDHRATAKGKTRHEAGVSAAPWFGIPLLEIQAISSHRPGFWFHDSLLSSGRLLDAVLKQE